MSPCGSTNMKHIHLPGHAAKVVRACRRPDQIIGGARLSCGMGDQDGSGRDQAHEPARHVHRTAEPVPGAADRKSGSDPCPQLRQAVRCRGINEFKDCVDETRGVADTNISRRRQLPSCRSDTWPAKAGPRPPE
jgi:hypothetical protein